VAQDWGYFLSIKIKTIAIATLYDIAEKKPHVIKNKSPLPKLFGFIQFQASIPDSRLKTTVTNSNGTIIAFPLSFLDIMLNFFVNK
jgi:hypothetical protein